MRARAIGSMELLDALPGPFERGAKKIASRRMQKVHYGQPVPIEECGEIFDIATSIVKIPCVCRTFAGHKPEAVCILVTTQPIEPLLEEGFRDYVDGPDVRLVRASDQARGAHAPRALRGSGAHALGVDLLTPFIGAICNCNVESGCIGDEAHGRVLDADDVARGVGCQARHRGLHLVSPVCGALPIRGPLRRRQRGRQTGRAGRDEVLGVRYMPKRVHLERALARRTPERPGGRRDLVAAVGGRTWVRLRDARGCGYRRARVAATVGASRGPRRDETRCSPRRASPRARIDRR